MDKTLNAITRSVSKLLKSDAFDNWSKQENLQSGDWVLINNSFLHRNAISTNKSNKYPGVRIRQDNEPVTQPFIVETRRQNSDFRRISAKSQNRPDPTPLTQAIEQQVEELGQLVYILIGTVDDSIIIDTELNHSGFAKVIWDPMQDALLKTDEETIRLSHVHDVEGIWSALVADYDDRETEPSDTLREQLIISLDKLQAQARANLRLPSGSSPNGQDFTQDIVQVLQEHRQEYQDALDAYANGNEGVIVKCCGSAI